MSGKTLTAAIITFNEEKNIADCISSVHDLADEVLVLDSFSTDQTEKIARSFPKVRFETHSFDGHVQQKNRAIEMASGEWIFSLDADERVTSRLADSIKKFINGNPDGKGARVKRLTVHMGRPVKHGGWYNSRFRLIRKGQGAWAGENPHDEIFIHGESLLAQKTWTTLNGDLIHYSFTDLSHQIDTINKFSSIVAFNRSARKKASLLKMIVKPPVKFIEMYFVKRGFLDGTVGFIVAAASSFSTFLKWAKLYEIQKTGIERPSNVRPDYKVQ